MAEPLNNLSSPWTAAVAPSVQGAFGLIGGALQYHYNKKLAEQQNQYNLNMWNLQNEYNSPQAQMKRLEEAGLNTALMYGQGSTGNASHAPEQVTPQAPDVQGPLRDLADAFNIEQLRTIVANRKKATAEATIAQENADDIKANNEAKREFAWYYDLDPLTGMYVPKKDINGEPLINNSSYSLQAQYYMHRLLEQNFRTNSLLFPRMGLIGESKELTNKRAQMLAPQIEMQQFDADWYKQFGYWSGPAINILKALLSVLRRK